MQKPINREIGCLVVSERFTPEGWKSRYTSKHEPEVLEQIE
jgi:hypothetical protein